MLQWATRALLAKVLLDPRTKAAVFGALEKAAKSTDTKIDDATLSIAQALWDTVIPALCAKK
jgi:hypothetical protein